MGRNWADGFPGRTDNNEPTGDSPVTVSKVSPKELRSIACEKPWNLQDIRRLIGFISFISGMAVSAFLYNPDLFQTVMEYIQNNPPEDKISTVLTGSGDECSPPLPDVTALQNGQIVTVLWPGNNGETTLQAYPVVVDAVSADGATFMGTPLNSDCTVADKLLKNMYNTAAVIGAIAIEPNDPAKVR